MSVERFDIAIVGAGLAGLATAYYLCARESGRSVLLLDPLTPMSLTSAQSGDNYRNWWPERSMVSFIDHSIDLMEAVADKTRNVIRMTRGGYALATRRANIDSDVEHLYSAYGTEAPGLIRIHEKSSRRYPGPRASDWTRIPNGVDIIRDPDLIRFVFPSFSADIENVLHIRRAGDLSGQQLGQYLLEDLRNYGVRHERLELLALEHERDFRLEIAGNGRSKQVHADILVNAAGPFAGKVAGLLGIHLPIETVLQQKIAFEDALGVIPRDLPFSVDLDDCLLDWTNEERELLAGDRETAWLTEPINGGIHCRPEGGSASKWVKLGWAYNTTPTEPDWEPSLDPHFPEIVVRGAAALNPRLRGYYDAMPRHVLYGGYYTKTPDNLPLIGPLEADGAFCVAALSGFGTMAALAAGELCADWIDGNPLPDYAKLLSMSRFEDAELIERLNRVAARSIL